jgi:hypothetical protein
METKKHSRKTCTDLGNCSASLTTSCASTWSLCCSYRTTAGFIRILQRSAATTCPAMWEDPAEFRPTAGYIRPHRLHRGSSLEITQSRKRMRPPPQKSPSSIGSSHSISMFYSFRLGFNFIQLVLESCSSFLLKL